MKTILVSGIGGPTPRSIARTIRARFPNFKLIGIDANPKAIGFFMDGLLDRSFVAPRIESPSYWPFIQSLVKSEGIDFAFIQPEKEVVGWGNYVKQNGEFPCPTFIPSEEVAITLMDKAIMADILEGTDFIPKTIKVTQQAPRFDEVENQIGFPCWIRATQGSGGLGSLRLDNVSSYKSWLFINIDIEEFTVSEFLTGRHLATQMLYFNGEYVKGASLECAEYVMASIAPSKVTGNTSFGRLLNEDRILKFCNDCISYVSDKLGVKANGVLSFDLKEDSSGSLKVTEVNIRHMAYTGVMAKAGFDLVSDTIQLLSDKSIQNVKKAPYFRFDKPYVFLRDVDIEPILLDGEHCFDSMLDA